MAGFDCYAWCDSDRSRWRHWVESAVRSDMQLGTFLKSKGIASLNDLVQSDIGKK